MARLIPFSYSFFAQEDNQGFVTFQLTGRKLLSLTVSVETDNTGHIMVSTHVLFEGKKHQYGQPTIIYKGDGINAKTFEKQQLLPLSRILPNFLIINWSNFCGQDATISFSGVVEK